MNSVLYVPSPEIHLSADCWCCGRQTYFDEPHADWCWVDDGDGRYYTDNPNRWPKGT